MTKRLFALSFCLLTAVVSAQFGDSRRATMTGSRGDRGKCTIEVEVDGVADVEVMGDTGRIRTLSGQPAVWRRFECSDAIPRNPADFRFRGIDGRGEVNLVADPRQGRGVAVVRISDPKGGREGYTFDLEWTGNSGSFPGGGGPFGRDRDDYRRNDDRDRDYRRNDDRGYRRDGPFDRRDDNYDRRDDNYDRRRNSRLGRENEAFTVTCEADGNRRRVCPVDTTGGVRLLRELGNAACRQGSDWGYDRRGIWVANGCQAEFEVGR